MSEDELSAGCVSETFCVSFSYNVISSYYCNNITSYCKELEGLKCVIEHESVSSGAWKRTEARVTA